MSDITAEKRLELIRNIREEHNRNRMSLKSRENILYGHGYETAAISDSGDTAPLSQKGFSTMGLRILAAIILFSLFVILDYTESSYFNINAEIVCEYLQTNDVTNAFDFIREITYTFTHE